ncbi:MAG: phosphoribosylpyrophosphate synthetase [Candidatus Fischerbacteria bacterium RBG_13_37_8]|uniref:Ribose-phosphate pyrophosphokinase n=1 Tax=Candidatus Fischerbacteria bacterium RBG_13_37_8 TaxID=1817863 RepID=A0A1F5VGC5_9BACT|nr:MAG: phosphoribosylpyrophosphate synthetase [Candidatus Fischerbacteria bacterium RBG_13_37_8]
MREPLKIFAGNSNSTLAKEICNILGLQPGEISISRFSDGEIYIQIQENVRGTDVYVVQSICDPVNDNLMELLIMIDSLKRASADRITAVIPYYGYARQDRKDKPRVPITSRLVADLLTSAGASRILTMDLHAQQIVGFFNIPVDHLFAAPVMLEAIMKMNLTNIVIVAPDAGAVERARAYAKRLATDLAIIDKRRVETNKAEVMNVIGEVTNKNVFLVDDMVDTAGTLVNAAKALKEKGAIDVYASCTHPVLSGPAIERIAQSDIKVMLVSNTIPVHEQKLEVGKIKVNSVANLFAKAIKNIHEETSISSLFV